MSSYEEELPERERQSSSLQFQQSLRAPSLSDLSLAKLQTRLQAQKGSAKLNLADSFIGDEGCDLLSRHLRDNSGTTTLELRGNNLTPDGIRRLIPAFKGPCTIKNLSLEWNVVGNGTVAIADLLSLNSSVTSLDLRNNRIGAEGAAALGRLIETNRVLSSLDLRWNDLGTEGGRVILQALQTAPRTIDRIELSGNKIPDELLQAIEGVLRGGRGAQESARSLSSPRRDTRDSLPRESLPLDPLPRESLPLNPEPQLSSRILTREKDYTEDLQSKYEANVFAQSLLEARNAELEQLLDQERKRSREIQSEIIKELEMERTQRAQVEENLMTHREEVVKREVEDERSLEDLDGKLSAAIGEKDALAQELNRLQDQYEKLAITSAERLKALEARQEQQQRLYAQLDTEAAKAYELQKQEHQQMLRDLGDEAEDRASILEEREMALATAKAAAETECKKLRTALSQVQTAHLQDLRDVESRARDEYERKYNTSFYLLEEKLKALEEARTSLIRKNQDIQRDIGKGEKKQMEQVLSVESERNRLMDERSQLRTQVVQLQAGIENLKNEVYGLNLNCESDSKEEYDLTQLMSQRSESGHAQIDQLSRNQAAERKEMEDVREEMNRQLRELEGRLGVVTEERDLVKGEYESLHEGLRVAFSRTVQDTMLDHMRKLEAEKLGK